MQSVGCRLGKVYGQNKRINYALHHILAEKGVPVHIKAKITRNGTQLNSRQSWWGQKIELVKRVYYKGETDSAPLKILIFRE